MSFILQRIREWWGVGIPRSRRVRRRFSNDEPTLTSTFNAKVVKPGVVQLDPGLEVLGGDWETQQIRKTTVLKGPAHEFMALIHLAYANHYTPVIDVNDVWTVILTGFAND